MKLVNRTAIAATGIGLAGALALYSFWGTGAFLGWAAGLGLAVISLYSFGLLGKIIAAGGAVPRQVTALTTMVWLLKLPILWFVVVAVVNAGPQVTTCFLAGLALVYFLLVLTALLDGKSGREGHF